jgi:O-antigen ligase
LQHYVTPDKIFGIFTIKSGSSFGSFVNRDHYAAFAELLLPVGLFEVFRDRGKAVWHAALTGLIFASVILCASRAGAAFVTLEVLILLAIAAKRRLLPRGSFGRLAVGILLSILLFTAVLGWEALWSRRHDQNPFQYRREMTVSAIRMGMERPWIGFGLGTFETAFPEFASFDLGLVVDHAHNDWAEWFAEGGAPMLLCVLAIAVFSARSALRCPWAMGVPVVFLHSLIDFPMQIPAIAAISFTMLAAASVEAQRVRRAPPDHTRD